MSDERPLEPGTIIANNYRVTSRLGAGGMGTVYLADNVTLNQRVVVKVLRGGQAGAGQEEAQMLANLQHPNVVTVYAHDPQLDCIVMEFLDGASLSTLLEKGIDRVNALRVALAVAEALAAVHRRGLVHRDIKPENVMLALNMGGGRLVDWLKLIDFGLALKAGRTPPVLLGTPEYCGPEQFYADAAAHPANDVYALGVTIFLMMTGRFPFDGPFEQLPHLHANAPVPNLVDTLVATVGRDALEPRTLALLEDLDDLLQAMLAKTVEERPTASEVASRLIRLESSFADAGTFVGAVKPPRALVETVPAKRGRSSTSVLKRATSTDATAPEAQPVPSSRSSDALQPWSQVTQGAERPRRGNQGLVLALLVLIGLLGSAVLLLVPGDAPPPAAPEPTPPVVEVVTPPAPVAVVDAGVAVVEELSALPGIKPVPKPKSAVVVAPVPKPVGCQFNDAFAAKARGTYAELARGATREQKDTLSDLSDELGEALVASDCKRADGVLGRMRQVVAPK